MALGLNTKQVEWAIKHDWAIESFVNSHNLYTVVVRVDVPSDLDNYTPGVELDTLVFTNFGELREWAGY